jgi:hypothetical protein
MESDSRVGAVGKATLEDLMRERIRAMIEAIVEEELAAALGASRSLTICWPVGSNRLRHSRGVKRCSRITSDV